MFTVCLKIKQKLTKATAWQPTLLNIFIKRSLDEISPEGDRSGEGMRIEEVLASHGATLCHRDDAESAERRHRLVTVRTSYADSYLNKGLTFLSN